MRNPLKGYAFVVDVATTPRHYDVQGHLNNGAAVLLFNSVRLRYVQELLLAGGGGGLVAEGQVVGVRELVCRYESEARPGEELRGGCRVLGRSRRSWLYDQVLVTGERLVARCRVVECVIRDGAAVEVPAAFWRIVEAAEGRAMGPGPLPGPRTDWEAVPARRT